MSTPNKAGKKPLTNSEAREELIMAEARVEALDEARRRLQSTEPIPATIEVLKGNIQKYKRLLGSA